jgi:hypothetical protein
VKTVNILFNIFVLLKFLLSLTYTYPLKLLILLKVMNKAPDAHKAIIKRLLKEAPINKYTFVVTGRK